MHWCVSSLISFCYILFAAVLLLPYVAPHKIMSDQKIWLFSTFFILVHLTVEYPSVDVTVDGTRISHMQHTIVSHALSSNIY